MDRVIEDKIQAFPCPEPIDLVEGQGLIFYFPGKIPVYCMLKIGLIFELSGKIIDQGGVSGTFTPGVWIIPFEKNLARVHLKYCKGPGNNGIAQD